MGLKNSAAELVALAEANAKMTFCFDESYEGKVRVEWMTCLCLEIDPDDLPKAIAAMKTLEALGVDTA